MSSWKFILLLIIGYAVVFFLISLWETKNLKDAFNEWLKALIDWRAHAIPGLIFILMLALVGFLIGEGNTQ
jgi:hypothetical protein